MNAVRVVSVVGAVLIKKRVSVVMKCTVATYTLTHSHTHTLRVDVGSRTPRGAALLSQLIEFPLGG